MNYKQRAEQEEYVIIRGAMVKKWEVEQFEQELSARLVVPSEQTGDMIAALDKLFLKHKQATGREPEAVTLESEPGSMFVPVNIFSPDSAIYQTARLKSRDIVLVAWFRRPRLIGLPKVN